MKKLPALLNTPAGVVIVLGLIVLATETLLMVLIGFLNPYMGKNLPEVAWILIDSVMLTAIILIALYILIFRPMRNQQAKLERQLDELRRFQKLVVGRELRMKDLADENAALRDRLAAAPPDGIKS